MADGLNRATLIGNLTADPELRETTQGRTLLRFRMATNESSYNPETKEKKDYHQYHNIALWGPRAEGLKRLLAKGAHVYVEGRIETRSYDDKDNVKRSITEIVASNIILLGSRRPHDGDDANASARSATTAPATASAATSASAPARPASPSSGYTAPARPARSPEPATETFSPPDGSSDDDIPF